MRNETRRDRLIAALLTAPSITAAAKQAGVGLRSATRWLAEPNFQSRYQAARAGILQPTVNILLSASLEAAGLLLRIVRGEQPPSAGLIAAARSVLEFGLKGRELENLEGDIKMLRAEVARRKM